MALTAVDLFCGAGGVTRGLQRAGFHVTGVDRAPQPRYCGDAFVQADAMAPPFDLGRFDLVWASPPCQGYSILGSLPWLKGKVYPKLVDPVREMLTAAGAPWVIENVPGAPVHGVELCGLMFGLPLYRHRIFETSWFLLSPPHQMHHVTIGDRRQTDNRGRTLNASSARGSWGAGGIVTVAGHQFKKVDGQRAMGIDWMTRPEMAQAIPPAFAEFIGRSAIEHITARRAA